MSNDLDVKHDDTDNVEESYVIGSEPAMELQDFISQFINEPEYLKVYWGDDNGGDEITDDEEIVGSFMTIALVIDGREYDRVTILIRGDLDGDGYVSSADNSIMEEIIAGKREETFFLNLISDVDFDEYISSADGALLSDFIGGKIDSLNTP